MLSFYALMIRIGFGHVIGADFKSTINGIVDGTIKPYLAEDKCKVSDAKKGIDKVLSKGDLRIFSRSIKKNYPAGLTTYVMHNNMGIAAFGHGYTQKVAPYWHRKGM